LVVTCTRQAELISVRPCAEFAVALEVISGKSALSTHHNASLLPAYCSVVTEIHMSFLKTLGTIMCRNLLSYFCQGKFLKHDEMLCVTNTAPTGPQCVQQSIKTLRRDWKGISQVVVIE